MWFQLRKRSKRKNVPEIKLFKISDPINMHLFNLLPVIVWLGGALFERKEIYFQAFKRIEWHNGIRMRDLEKTRWEVRIHWYFKLEKCTKTFRGDVFQINMENSIPINKHTIVAWTNNASVRKTFGTKH